MRTAELSLDRLAHSFFVLDDDGGVGGWGRNGQLFFLQKGQMLFHSPPRLVQAILDGVADAAESLQIGGVKPKEGGIVRRFNDERILEVDHVTPPDA